MIMLRKFTERIETIKAYPNYAAEIRVAFADVGVRTSARFEKDPARKAFLNAVDLITDDAFNFVNLDNGNKMNLPEDVLEDHRASRAALKEAFPMLEKIVIGGVVTKPREIKI